jgi:hypothetical protein
MASQSKKNSSPSAYEIIAEELEHVKKALSNERKDKEKREEKDT